MRNHSRLLKTGHVAKRFGVSNTTVGEWVRAGLLVPDQRTVGRQMRFREETIQAFEKKRKGETELSDNGYQAFDFKTWILAALPPILRQWFSSTDLTEGNLNSIHLTFDLADERILVSSSHRNQDECPFRSIRRHGEQAVVLNVGFENPPTYGQAIESVMDFLHQILDSILVLLQSVTCPVHTSRRLVVHPLRCKGWFWIRISEFEYLLRLPKTPTTHEWEIYAVKCLVHYQAVAGATYSPPPFFFHQGESQGKTDDSTTP